MTSEAADEGLTHTNHLSRYWDRDCPACWAMRAALAPVGEMFQGDSLDLISTFSERPDLIVTDPPYALRGDGDEHAITATVAIVLREAATKLNKGGWMLVMCASSWRSQAYMAEAVRGLLEPIRTMTWCKPVAKSKAKTSGPAFASVQVLVFKKGKSLVPPHAQLDHITAPPVINGRRAELPPEVADWMVRPYAVLGGLLLDPFAGSGAILLAAQRAGMRAVGFERDPLPPRPLGFEVFESPPAACGLSPEALGQMSQEALL